MQSGLAVYRGYVPNNDGRIPGYWVFPFGLYLHAKAGNAQ